MRKNNRKERQGRKEEMITIEQNTQMILSELSDRLRVSALKEEINYLIIKRG
ncbi:hypothetical protein KJ762_10585 [bacterium]|nr:hypothetical protein [bacterium]MBU1634941.1 hypothetical protein [bacterium]MBU1875348.1 hypothetical protein [bacterium]